MAEDANGTGTGKTAWRVVAGGVAVAGAVAIYFLTRPDLPAPDPQVTSAASHETAQDSPVATPVEDSEAEAAAPDSSTDQTSASNPVDETETAEAPVAEPEAAAAPALDLIRVDPDGAATLAGKAEPGSRVQVLLDGEEVHSFEVDQSGQFAALFPIAPDAAPRTLTLRSDQGDHSALSDDFVIAAVPGNTSEHAEQNSTPSTDTPEASPTSETAAEDVASNEEPSGTEPPARASPSDTPEPTAGTTSEAGTSSSDPKATPESAPVILRSDAEGVELVQPSQVAAAGQGLQLDTIGYTDQGQVSLTGRAAPGATVRVYLDNKAKQDLNAGEQGRWRGEIAGVAPGIYTLRLDALDQDGKVIDRLETPFRREAPESLVASDTDTPTQTATIRAITVQQGDTLWAISRDRYGDGEFFVRVFDANRDSIRNPDLIYPGQVFNLPE